MPKKIKLESFKYRFLIEAQQLSCGSAIDGQFSWEEIIAELEFNTENNTVYIKWNLPCPGTISFDLDEPNFYVRGDDNQHVAHQRESGLIDVNDKIKLDNEAYFNKIVRRVAQSVGYEEFCRKSANGEERLSKERLFHDAWASSEYIENIDVRAVNEACTSPEMRYIMQRLGSIRGKTVLDVGCGLGEASVYFALLGAIVTSSDLSEGMLNAACRLAHRFGVSITTHIAAAEDMQLPSNTRFDIIYAGNLLHHADIDQTLVRLKSHLAPGGVIVTWDPVAYNPAINVYRAIAMGTRTSDEHPLKWSDIQLFKKHFSWIETRYFWLTTLVIFVIMALIQRRNPSKERFWKVVVQEEKKWRWLYQPLEKLDRFLLKFIPPLRLLCWNVVIISKI